MTTTMIVEVGGNSFQLSDDGILLEDILKPISKNIQDSSYIIGFLECFETSKYERKKL